MRIGIIHTVHSPCRCAEAAADGLRTLGHEPVLANSEEIESQAYDLVRRCDLFIDHTDTFKGRGLFRAMVRQVLESAGARIVGSDSRACLLADNKIAAKERLSASGLPVPIGIVATRKDVKFPSWLKPPLVLKPSFEHMSRGLRLAENLSEGRIIANDLLDSKKQPILIESFIPGREIAVSVIHGPEGLETLPILEWTMDESEKGILSEAFKLTDPPPHRRDALQAGLTGEKAAEICDLALAAFQALGLRDYARFDLRISPEGQPFFLEANVTPSLEPQEAFALSANWGGLSYPKLIERMLLAAQRRYKRDLASEERVWEIDLPSGRIKMKIPGGVHVPPPSTVDLSKILDIKKGDRVLDLGCGSGFLSIAAAKSGAGHVLATDLDPVSLDTTLANARGNGVEDIIEVSGGSWYEAVPLDEKEKKFDVIIATPPQTPGHRPFGPKFGGFDGTRHILQVVDQAPSFLNPETGRIWILAISLANPKRIIDRLKKQFSEVSLRKETDRFFTVEEYNGYEEGLFAHLDSLRKDGRSEFREVSEGRFVFRNLFICAQGLRR